MWSTINKLKKEKTYGEWKTVKVRKYEKTR